MTTNMTATYSDSTGRVEISRFKAIKTGQWQWSVRVDGAWLGHYGGGLASVANHAAAYTRYGMRPINEDTLLADLNIDLVRRALKEAQS